MTVPFGTYLEPWEPDEEILASTLNLRERKYGGLFLHDFMGATDAPPIISVSTAGYLYGDAVQYGYLIYKAVAGAGLINDSLSISEGALTFSTGSAYAIYDEPKKYGFLAYGYQNALSEAMAVSDSSPTVVVGAVDQQYDDPDAFYGLMQYGYQNGLIQDTLGVADSTITINSANTSPVKYGTGKKHGFCAWQA